MKSRTARTAVLAMVWPAVFAAGLAVAPPAQADTQRYLCDQIQIVDTHGIGTGNCVSAGGNAPAMGLITGAFDITRRSDNYTVHCNDNNGMATGESWLPGEVNGVAAHCTAAQ